jgi:hypothetical protein
MQEFVIDLYLLGATTQQPRGLRTNFGMLLYSKCFANSSRLLYSEGDHELSLRLVPPLPALKRHTQPSLTSGQRDSCHQRQSNPPSNLEPNTITSSSEGKHPELLM